MALLTMALLTMALLTMATYYGCRISQASLVASLCGLRMCMAEVADERDVHLSYVPLAHVFERSMQLVCLVSGAAVGFYHGVQNDLLDDLRELKPTLLVGLPGAFRLLYRKYDAMQRQWSAPYRLLYQWAWRRKCRAIAEGCGINGGITDGNGGGSHFGGLPTRLLERLLFGTVAASLGGRLRYVLVCDRDMDAEVRQFFEVAVSAAVLPVFGFPEAGGLVAMLTPSARALTARRTKAKRLNGSDDAGGGMHGHPYSMNAEGGPPSQGGEDQGTLMNAATVDSAGFPLPCNELKLVPVEGDFASSSSSGGGGHMHEGAPYGELHIRGANTFEGYQGKDHLTEEAYGEGRWLKTGYICTCTAEGQLRVLGKRTSFLQPRRGLFVCAQRLETIYAHRCAMVHQIWCHCDL